MLVLCLRLQPFWSSLSGNRRFITNVQWKKLMKLLFFFQNVPLHQTRKATDPRKTSTKEAYFEYNLQQLISFTNNSLQGHNRSTKMNLETKGSIRKKKNLT